MTPRERFWGLLLATLPIMIAAPGTVASEPESVANIQTLAAPQGLSRLAPDSDVWLDIRQKRVIVDGRVVLRRGSLEMFACPQGTKEHESVVAVKSAAQIVHAALLAAGASTGHPVKFDPEYTPATGTEIDVQVIWKDKDGKLQKARAQEWIRNMRTGGEAKAKWVFAGSSFWTDPSNGQRYYQGDGGDFICVSNFPTATLDLTIPSSKTDASLLFEAFTERIPPEGTPVRLVLTPKLKADVPVEAKTDP